MREHEDYERFQEQAAQEPTFYTVAPYLVDRRFGGPEEGGWWYDAGELAVGDDLPMPLIVKTIHDARAARVVMQDLLDKTVNVGRRPISSVLSTGKYQAEIHDNWAPPFYPNGRPHYE